LYISKEKLLDGDMTTITTESSTGGATARTRRGWEVPAVKKLSIRAASKKDVTASSTAPPHPPKSLSCEPKVDSGIEADNKGGFKGKSGTGTDTDNNKDWN
jgi:hypothetical protein